MIALFTLNAYEIDPAFRQILARLQDVAGQEARFILRSQGYQVKHFCIGRLGDRIASRGNSFAYWFNRKFDKEIGDHGLKMAKILPERLNLSFPVRFLVQEISEAHPARQEPHAQSPVNG